MHAQRADTRRLCMPRHVSKHTKNVGGRDTYRRRLRRRRGLRVVLSLLLLLEKLVLC